MTPRERAERLVAPYRNWMFGYADRIIDTLEREFQNVHNTAYRRGYEDAQWRKPFSP